MPISCVLTIGGTDPSGGAGLAADARACAAFGTHALPIVTAVVAQNTRGVQTFEAVSPALLAAQLDHLLDDITPRAVKTGLIPNVQSIEIIAARLKNLKVPIIVDPVFAPSSGGVFSDDETIVALCELLLPLCELVTPNWTEAISLNFGEFTPDIPVKDWQSDAEALAVKLQNVLFLPNHSPYVLIKGGDAQADDAESCDVLCGPQDIQWFRSPRIQGLEVRGTGCMLASAIAAQRAQNVPMHKAVENAKHWITQQIEYAALIGKGRRVATNFQPQMPTEKHG